MTRPPITPSEADALAALGENFGAIGAVFLNDQGSPEALRMAVASLRAALDVLDAVAERWQKNT